MVEHVLGPSAAALVAIGILISTFGCVNGMVLAGARVSLCDGHGWPLLPQGRHPQPGAGAGGGAVDAGALGLAAVPSPAPTASSSTTIIFAVPIFYVLTISGLFKLRRDAGPDHPRPYRAVGYPALPALYLLAAAAVAVSLLLATETRFQSLCGLACVLAGLPVFALTLRKRARLQGPILRRST